MKEAAEIEKVYDKLTDSLNEMSHETTSKELDKFFKSIEYKIDGVPKSSKTLEERLEEIKYIPMVIK